MLSFFEKIYSLFYVHYREEPFSSRLTIEGTNLVHKHLLGNVSTILDEILLSF